MSNLRLGIDIGSTTAKAVILNGEKDLVFSAYHCHNAETLQTLKTFGASLKRLNFRSFYHLISKTNLILAISSHFTIASTLAKKQIFSKWGIRGAFAPNLEPKWEKNFVKTSTIGYRY